MSSFEQTIPQLEAALAEAERDLEDMSKRWQRATTFPNSSDAERTSIILSAVIQLVEYRRKALKRAVKAAGNVSDTARVYRGRIPGTPR